MRFSLYISTLLLGMFNFCIAMQGYSNDSAHFSPRLQDIDSYIQLQFTVSERIFKPGNYDISELTQDEFVRYNGEKLVSVYPGQK